MAIIDVIKYDDPFVGGLGSKQASNDVLVYKYPREDFNSGSQLIVHEFQEAIFFRDGKALDRFGAGKYTLDTESLPGMKGFFKLVAHGESQFHAEVYFVNLITLFNVKWGTDTRIRMFDPATGIHIEIGAYGEFNIKVVDGLKVLLKVVGFNNSFNRDEILSYGSAASTSGKFKALLMTKVKSFLPKAIKENNINVLEIDEHLDELSEYVKEQLNEGFESYGFAVPNFFITYIDLGDELNAVKTLHKRKFEEVQKAKVDESIAIAETSKEHAIAEKNLVKAQGEAEVQKTRFYAEAEQARAAGLAEADVIKAKGEAEAQSIRAQELAHAEGLRAQGGNYQAETTRKVGEAFASNEGGGAGGSGVVPAISGVVQAGVGIGAAVAVGKATAGVVSGTLNDLANPSESNKSQPAVAGWTCPKCGAVNTGKFCQECGEKKPVEQNSWVCPKCGAVNTGKFCSECGEKKPAMSEEWTCPKCGAVNTGKFCQECGTKKED